MIRILTTSYILTVTGKHFDLIEADKNLISKSTKDSGVMEIIMKLHPAPFEMIKTGRKTIELRLYDEKRREISIGDIIRFCNIENPKSEVKTRVIDLYRFDSFRDLYAALPLLECGYTEDDVVSASADDMNEYYSQEEQQKYGVVGIRVCLL